MYVSDLLIQLWLKFGGRYGSDLFQFKTKESEEGNKWLKELETHAWMIGELKIALANNEWKTLGDASVSHQVISNPKKKILTENQRKRKSAMNEYGHKPLQKRMRIEAESKD